MSSNYGLLSLNPSARALDISVTNRPPPESAAIFNDLPDISFTDAASRSDLLATFTITNTLGSLSVAAGIDPATPFTLSPSQ